MQVMIEHQEGLTGDDLEREMFILRKLIESEKASRIGSITAEKDPKAQADAADFYVCTLSNRVMVYKVAFVVTSMSSQPNQNSASLSIGVEAA